GPTALSPHHCETTDEKGERSRRARRIDLRCRVRRRWGVDRYVLRDMIVAALEIARVGRILPVVVVVLALAAIPADLEIILIIGRRGGCRGRIVVETDSEGETQRRICRQARLADRLCVLKADEVAMSVAAAAASGAQPAGHEGESAGCS